MKYVFSSPDSVKHHLFEMGVENYLLSFAVDARAIGKFLKPGRFIIVDSGAFTVWNRGKGEIDIDKYIEFINGIDAKLICINLDVIPQTGSTKKQIEECAERSYENYLYLLEKSKHPILPVYHYGENIDILKRYAKHTDYIGISPANDTHENIKRQFLDEVFKFTNTDIKTHGLGYSSFSGLYRYPFYSVDSISYKRIFFNIDDDKYGFFGSAKALSFFQKKRIKDYLELEKNVTEVWKRRGISWD